MVSVLNKDYKEMLQSLKDNEVEFLIVGAYAMAAHGYPRATGDIDLWVMASRENAKRVYNALKEFGAPLAEIDDTTFAQKNVVFQIGVVPRRIDIITSISGVEFEPAYRNRTEATLDGPVLPFISKEDLIVNKKATGRKKDLADIEALGQQ
jgi:predicted nucleotidyltransferase